MALSTVANLYPRMRLSAKDIMIGGGWTPYARAQLEMNERGRENAQIAFEQQRALEEEEFREEQAKRQAEQQKIENERAAKQMEREVAQQSAYLRKIRADLEDAARRAKREEAEFQEAQKQRKLYGEPTDILNLQEAQRKAQEGKHQQEQDEMLRQEFERRRQGAQGGVAGDFIGGVGKGIRGAIGGMFGIREEPESQEAAEIKRLQRMADKKEESAYLFRLYGKYQEADKADDDAWKIREKVFDVQSKAAEKREDYKQKIDRLLPVLQAVMQSKRLSNQEKLYARQRILAGQALPEAIVRKLEEVDESIPTKEEAKLIEDYEEIIFKKRTEGKAKTLSVDQLFNEREISRQEAYQRVMGQRQRAGAESAPVGAPERGGEISPSSAIEGGVVKVPGQIFGSDKPVEFHPLAAALIGSILKPEKDKKEFEAKKLEFENRRTQSELDNLKALLDTLPDKQRAALETLLIMGEQAPSDIRGEGPMMGMFSSELGVFGKERKSDLIQTWEDFNSSASPVGRTKIRAAIQEDLIAKGYDPGTAEQEASRQIGLITQVLGGAVRKISRSSEPGKQFAERTATSFTGLSPETINKLPWSSGRMAPEPVGFAEQAGAVAGSVYGTAGKYVGAAKLLKMIAPGLFALGAAGETAAPLAAGRIAKNLQRLKGYGALSGQRALAPMATGALVGAAETGAKAIAGEEVDPLQALKEGLTMAPLGLVPGGRTTWKGVIGGGATAALGASTISQMLQSGEVSPSATIEDMAAGIVLDLFIRRGGSAIKEARKPGPMPPMPEFLSPGADYVPGPKRYAQEFARELEGRAIIGEAPTTARRIPQAGYAEQINRPIFEEEALTVPGRALPKMRGRPVGAASGPFYYGSSGQTVKELPGMLATTLPRTDRVKAIIEAMKKLPGFKIRPTRLSVREIQAMMRVATQGSPQARRDFAEGLIKKHGEEEFLRAMSEAGKWLDSQPLSETYTAAIRLPARMQGLPDDFVVSVYENGGFGKLTQAEQYVVESLRKKRPRKQQLIPPVPRSFQSRR